jgi:exopolysaccharide biosynthesis polyprenyl glycosylphosphotransferase
VLEERTKPIAALRPGIRRQPGRLQRFLTVSLVVQDAVLIYVALSLAYWLRYGFKLGPTINGAVPFSAYQRVALLLLGIMMCTLFLKGAYRARLNREAVGECALIFSASTIAVAIVVVITFMLHMFEYSRGVIVYLWVLLIALLILGRAVFRLMQRYAHRRGWGVRRLLVVGASDVGKMIMQSVVDRHDLGYEVVGFVDRRNEQRVPDFGRFHRLGNMEDVSALIQTGNVDEIVIALPGSAHDETWSIVKLCDEQGVELKLVPDLFEMSLDRVQVDGIGGIPLLQIQEKRLRRLERIGKRILDLFVGCVLVLVTSPIIALLGLMIRLESRGPAFIKQERLGLNGRRFTCWKLRTMHVDADRVLAKILGLNEASGPIFKMRNDPRCTRIGRRIRRWSLDELPQVWNVVRGDMSLVGPRPPLPAEVVKYEPWQMRRLEITPGMTGIWQVSGRSDLSFDEMLMMDMMYVDNWSLGLDFQILLRTVKAVLGARGAY